MKRRIFLAGLFLIVVLSGCMNAVQLGERAIVQAVGVDLTQDGGYRITFQISGDSSADKGAAVNYVAEENGPSMSEIMTKAASTQGKQIFLGSCQLVVLGADAAKAGIKPILGFFNANHRINPSMTVALAAGTANEILRVVEEEPMLGAERITDMIRNAYLAGNAPRARLMDVLGAEENGNLSAALPVLAFSQEDVAESGPPSEPEEGAPSAQDSGASSESSSSDKPKKTLEVSRMGLFRGDRLENLTDLTAVRGYAWTQNQIKVTVVTVEDSALGRVSIVTSGQKAALSVEQVADLMVFNIEVKVQGAAMEVLLRDGSRQMGEAQREFAQALMEEQITEEIEHTIESTQRKGLDLLGVSLLVRQRYPDYYEAHADNWDQTIADAGYSVDVICDINRSGVDTANPQ